MNTNTGPDFFNAQLKISDQLWVGTVEIHVKSSDWYVHQHEMDANYDAVILHVVWEHDMEVYMKNNVPLPTIVLQDYIPDNILTNYDRLFHKNERWISCETQITEVDTFLFHNWLERLYFERLERKSVLIYDLLEKSNNDFEAVLFQLLAKNFGLKVNGDSFLSLAQSVEFSLLRKVRHDRKVISALLFGQAGFLEKEVDEDYFRQLKVAYIYLQKKHGISPCIYAQFQFFRMRPANFPTVRLAQLIGLYHRHSNLFYELMNLESLEAVYTFFSIEVDSFWKNHYTFEATSKKTHKKLTKSFIDLLIINTIVPLKFVWMKSRGESLHEDIFLLLREMKPEKNTIVSKFSEINISSTNAFETQALLELKNKYCDLKLCLSCVVGNKLLRNKIT
ncbi:conserved protein of unknown function [Tenacibaculum sp. 190130A14a]|uniref:DUF2851 family protein n=1 Tax=Tenacibaculum polynesiense TaxID=3137857 RepID=A0ABM9PDV5_9FLAO